MPPLAFDPYLLSDHFDRHGHQFAAVTEEEYEALAVVFITKILPGSPVKCRACPTCSCLAYGAIHECVVRGDRIRFDTRTQEFGVLSASGFIRTYYKPDPNWTGVSGINYFHRRCLP